MTSMVPDSIRHRQAYHARLKARTCVDCDQPPVPGRLRCAHHLAAGAAASRKRLKRLLPMLKGLHLCTRCKQRKVVTGRTKCGVCAEESDTTKMATQRQRLKQGLCRCGRERDDPNHIGCSHCRARVRKSNNAYKARQRAKRRAA